MKRLAILALVTGLGFTASAQVNKTDIGIEGGPSLVTLYGKNTGDYHDSGFGYSAGVFIQHNFTKVLSLRTGVYFDRKGSQEDGMAFNEVGDIIGQVSFKNNFDYITVPLMARATVGNKVKLFVNAGPYFSYLMKQTQILRMNGELWNENDGTDNYKSFDIGISAGAGVGIPIKDKLMVSLEVRNNLGLMDINDSPYISNPVKTNATNLLVGVAYKLSPR